jgi:hypothetical protein
MIRFLVKNKELTNFFPDGHKTREELKLYIDIFR